MNAKERKIVFECFGITKSDDDTYQTHFFNLHYFPEGFLRKVPPADLVQFIAANCSDTLSDLVKDSRLKMNRRLGALKRKRGKK